MLHLTSYGAFSICLGGALLGWRPARLCNASMLTSVIERINLSKLVKCFLRPPLLKFVSAHLLGCLNILYSPRRRFACLKLSSSSNSLFSPSATCTSAPRNTFLLVSSTTQSLSQAIHSTLRNHQCNRISLAVTCYRPSTSISVVFFSKLTAIRRSDLCSPFLL